MNREFVEEIKGHSGVVAEDLKSDIRALGEGQSEVWLGRDVFRTAAARELEETRALIGFSYGKSDRRITGLETEVAHLRTRLERVGKHLASQSSTLV